MRTVFTIILAVVFSFSLSLFSQQDLIPFKKDKFWGYCDRAGNVVLAPQFYQAYPFYNNKALVLKKSESGSEYIWGYISPNGKLIESDPHAITYVVISRDLFPDENGWLSVHLSDQKVKKFTKKKFLVNAPEMVDEKDEDLNSAQSVQIKDGKWYYPSLNSTAQLINEGGKKKEGIGEDLIMGGKFIILNDGKSISLPPKVQPMRGFVNGYLPVMIEPSTERVLDKLLFVSEYYNVVDTHGKMFFPNPIKYLRIFDEGYFFTGNGKDTLTIRDRNMKEIKTFTASKVLSSNQNGVFLIQDDVNHRLSAYDSKENRHETSSSVVSGYCSAKPLSDRFFALSLGSGKYALVEISSAKFYPMGEAEPYDIADDRYILLKENQKYRILDFNAENQNAPIRFDDVTLYFNYGVYLWKNEGKSGIRRFSGEDVFTSECTCLHMLPEGLVHMKLPDDTRAYGDVKTGKIFQVKD
jgi:hypothetical protein